VSLLPAVLDAANADVVCCCWHQLLSFQVVTTWQIQILPFMLLHCLLLVGADNGLMISYLKYLWCLEVATALLTTT
jgi:hypothetical protein